MIFIQFSKCCHREGKHHSSLIIHIDHYKPALILLSLYKIKMNGSFTPTSLETWIVVTVIYYTRYLFNRSTKLMKDD